MSIDLGDYLEEVETVVQMHDQLEIIISLENLIPLLTKLHKIEFNEIYLENSKFKTFRKLLLFNHPNHETDFEVSDKVYPYFLLCALLPIAKKQLSVSEPLENSVITLKYCFSLVRGTTQYGLDLLRRTRIEPIFNVLGLTMLWILEFCKELVKQTVIKHGRDDVQDKLDDKHHPFFEHILAEVYEKSLPIEVSEGMLSSNIERCKSWRKLFEKFKNTSSKKEFILEKSKNKCCIYCKTEISEWIDKSFVILDSCDHIFCVEGFRTYLNKSYKRAGRCPECGIDFQAWGTSDEYKSFRLLIMCERSKPQAQNTNRQTQDQNISSEGEGDDLSEEFGPCLGSPRKKIRINLPGTSQASGSGQSVDPSSPARASNVPPTSHPPCPSYNGCQPLCCEPSYSRAVFKGAHFYPLEVKNTDKAIKELFHNNQWLGLWRSWTKQAFVLPVVRSFVNLTFCDIMNVVDMPSDCATYSEYLLEMNKVHVGPLDKVFSLMRE